MQKILLAFVLVLLAFPDMSGAAPSRAFPKAVVQKILELANACKDAGGKPQDSDRPFLYKRFDFNGDGKSDWLVDSAGFMCVGNPQLFRSPSGSRFDVFITNAAGAKRVYAGVAAALHVTESTPSRIMITLMGEPCALGASANTTCGKQLVWSPRKKTFALANLTVAAEPAAPAIAAPTQSTTSSGHAEVEAWANAHYNKSGNEISSLDVFEGDFTGDDKADAIAFIRYYCEGCGNSDRIFVALFRNTGGHLSFYREAQGVYGGSPRDPVFSVGRILVTTTMPKPGDARCCPSGEKRWTIATN